ncbi:MAG: ribose-phosphate pyrophosphokinase [Candidatus Muirbacterium halophilum]|nr:ribose-phosphate pyrophosphokinase [Candidatus Muirbacterium halophilum]MCK9474791.1 ribose-phosphate pyrophosphokinase [Candidatus Muirbacterium halophilum]
MAILCGGGNEDLSTQICDYLGVKKCNVDISKFADGEIHVQIFDTVRGKDVFIIQPTCSPVSDNLMTLLIIIDSLKRASAGRITAVIPYFGYARQEKKSRGREPITAKLVSNLIVTAGVDRVLALDFHTWALQGFFDIPVDHFLGSTLLADYFLDMGFKKNDIVVVSPDAGGVGRARNLAKKLKASLAIIDKRRQKPNESEVMNIIGDIEGKITILVDDMIDTAGTICNGAKVLKQNGAKRVFAAASHGVFSGPAAERLNQSVIEEVVVTNSIPVHRDIERIKVISIAPLFAKAIYNIHREKSLSQLFES